MAAPRLILVEVNTDQDKLAKGAPLTLGRYGGQITGRDSDLAQMQFGQPLVGRVQNQRGRELQVVKRKLRKVREKPDVLDCVAIEAAVERQQETAHTFLQVVADVPHDACGGWRQRLS